MDDDSTMNNLKSNVHGINTRLAKIDTPYRVRLDVIDGSAVRLLRHRLDGSAEIPITRIMTPRDLFYYTWGFDCGILARPFFELASAEGGAVNILGKPASWHPSQAAADCLGVLIWAGQFVRLDQSLPATLLATVPPPCARSEGDSWADLVLALLAYGYLRR